MEYQETERLVRLAQKGDVSSFHSLYKQNVRRVQVMAFRLVGENAMEDVVQDTFLKVWKYLPSLEEPRTFPKWIGKVAWSVITEKRKSFAKNQEKDSLESLKGISDNGLSSLRLENSILVQELFKKLSEKDRDILFLIDLENWTMEEVAEMMGIPVGTVKSRLFNARKKARIFLKKGGEYGLVKSAV